jgi:phage portal protein BeeE
MASFWSRLRKKDEPETRDLSINDWISQMKSQQTFGYRGNRETAKQESIGDQFIEYVHGAYRSSGVVFACCQARQIIFSEARFAFQDISNYRPGDLADGPELDLLDVPWEGGTTGELLARAIQDVDLSGNHYVVKEYKGEGKWQLRRLRPDWVDIVLTADPKMARQADIDGYLYRPDRTEDKRLWEYFPVDGSNGRIAHWAPIPDPEAMFRGMSWLTPVVREIMGDKAISDHKLKFFENAATPNLSVSLKETVSKEDFEEFVEAMDATKVGVEHAYETLYLGGGADVQVIGANVQQMDFKVVTAIGETRIAAAARVPASVAGISEGLGGSSLNEGNFNAAKDQFASGTLRPLWRSICAAYAPLIQVPKGKRLWFDDRDISFLREDQLKVAQRFQIDVTSVTRLVMNGWKPDESVRAVQERNLGLLVGAHSGLYSVQLLPPEVSKPDLAAAKKAEADAEQAKGDKKKDPPANQQGTGSKRRPGPGRPSKSETKSDEWLDAVRDGEDWREDWEDEDDQTDP